jgi:hypothetical protein
MAKQKSDLSIDPSHKGRLHRALGVPEDQPIPLAALAKAKKSSDPHMRAMATYALNAKTKWGKN